MTDLIANASPFSPYGVSELRRQFAYGRLLARVFQDQPQRWVLKGATSLLARLPGRARHSIDVDLYFEGELEAALDALRGVAVVDLGDFFSFDIERGANLAGVTAGGQIRVTAYLGDKVFEAFRVDVVITSTMTSSPDVIAPIDPVKITGLHSVPYRVHPLPDQIADKHGAMVDTYAGRPSTRYRDLVDLVLIATSQPIDAIPLRTALLSEHGRRGTTPSAVLSLPSDDWHQGYRKIASRVADLDVLDAEQAVEIVRRLIDPVIAGQARGTWDPMRQEWQST